MTAVGHLELSILCLTLQTAHNTNMNFFKEFREIHLRFTIYHYDSCDQVHNFLTVLLPRVTFTWREA